MMDHVPFDDLSARLDGALPEARIRQIDAHLAACDACRDEYESLRWSVSFTKALPHASLPAGVSFHVPTEEPAKVYRWRPARVETMVVAVASLAALALFALVVGSRLPGDAVRQLALERSPRLGQADTAAGDVAMFDAEADVSDQSEGHAAAPVIDEASEMLGRSVGEESGSSDQARAGESVGGTTTDNRDIVSDAAESAPVDPAAIATRESRVSDAPVWQALEDQRLQRTDRQAEGYPRPLATAREMHLREVGAVAPPPEIGLLQARREPTEAESDAERDAEGEVATISGRAAGADDGIDSAVADDLHGSPDDADASQVGALGVALATRAALGTSTAEVHVTATARARPRTASPPETGSEAPLALTPVAGTPLGSVAAREAAGTGDAAADVPVDTDEDAQDEAYEDTYEDAGVGITSDAISADRAGSDGDKRVAALEPRTSTNEAQQRLSGAEQSAERGSDAGVSVPASQPVPWIALVGLALAFAALSLLLIVRLRRPRRYR